MWSNGSVLMGLSEPISIDLAHILLQQTTAMAVVRAVEPICRRNEKPTSGLEPLTLVSSRVCLRTFLARTGASGFPPIYAVVDDLAVSLCPLCTSAYQPGCSTGCSTCVVRMRVCASGAFTIPYIDARPNM